MTPDPSPGRRAGLPRHAVTAVASRPGLWWTALIQVAVLANPGWWKRWPPIPRPDPDYLRFRLETAYGDPDAEVAAGDVVEYLAWCHEARRRKR